MLTNMMMTGRALAGPFMTTVSGLRTRLNDWLFPAETMPPQGASSSGLPTWVVVLLAVVVLIACVLPLCAVVTIAILTLLGPSIGNVFSNIIDNIQQSP